MNRIYVNLFEITCCFYYIKFFSWQVNKKRSENIVILFSVFHHNGYIERIAVSAAAYIICMCCIQISVLKFKSCIRTLFYYDRPGIPADFDTTNILGFYFLLYVFFMLDTRVLYSLVIIPTGGEEKHTKNTHP